MSIEIESEDIIRLILQFFDEQKLDKARKALEAETTTKLNTVTNKEIFIQDIVHGKWDTVLQTVVTLNIRPKLLIDLYEQVILELAELRELGAARSLLRQSHPMFLLKQQHPERYLHLEHILSRTLFDPQEVYPGHTTKEKRRQAIAKALANEVTVEAPSRLMTLLEQSAKWQDQEGLSTLETFSPFGGGSATARSNKEPDASHKKDEKRQQDLFTGTVFRKIKMPGKSSYAESITYSSDGRYFATGSVDGFIEIWNPQNGKLRKDIRYQAEGNLMAMDESVISLHFSRDSELLISGSTDGKIAVWRVQMGTCKRRISPAHSQGVTSVQLNQNSTHILSGSYDQLIKIHSIKSGKLLKEFKGHTSFINSVLYINDDANILSGSSDGTVKLWSVESTDCLSTIQPNPSPSVPVQSVFPLHIALDQYVICNKSKKLWIYSHDGNLIRSLPSDNDAVNTDFISAALSSQGEILYGVTEEGQLFAFHVKTGELVGSINVCNAEIISMASHPMANIVAINDAEGHVYLLKP